MAVDTGEGGDPFRRAMRSAARVVGVASGIFWVIYGIVASSYEGLGTAGRLAEMTPGLVFLVSALVAFRWELVGGVLLGLEGVAAWCLLALSGGPPGMVVEVGLLLGLPLMLAGGLFIWLGRGSNAPRARAGAG